MNSATDIFHHTYARGEYVVVEDDSGDGYSRVMVIDADRDRIVSGAAYSALTRLLTPVRDATESMRWKLIEIRQKIKDGALRIVETEVIAK